MPRPYNALNGEELKEAILAKIRAELELDTRFRPSTTYPIVKYGFRLRIEAYPQEPATSELSVNGQIVSPEAVEGELLQPEVVSIEVIEKVEDPDRAREDASLPVPVPTKLKSGEVVDLLQAQRARIPALKVNPRKV